MVAKAALAAEDSPTVAVLATNDPQLAAMRECDQHQRSAGLRAKDPVQLMEEALL